MSIKLQQLKKLTTPTGVITALAIDQRGALRRMMGESVTVEQMADFKKVVSRVLTPYASAILLDPEVGFPAAQVRDENCGLLMAYEKTGYDKTVAGRYPDLIDDVSAYNLKERGADAVKLLLYYDVDEGDLVNNRKKAFVERVGAECQALDLPFFLEIVSYDANVSDEKAYAALKPRKVNEAMKVFSDARYGVDVLKVEVPVNMKFVEGYAEGDVVYTRAEALKLFKEQAEATNLPFIFLSAGVSAKLFQQTLEFAKEAGSTFNGVLCGRATWANGVAVYQEKGYEASVKWMETEGRRNVDELNEVIARTATPIKF